MLPKLADLTLLRSIQLLALLAHGDAAKEDGHRRCHLAIGLWLARHHCHLAGPGREVIYHDATAGTPTVEIQYPIAGTG